MFHVYAHSVPNSTEPGYNAITDEQTRTQAVEVDPDSNDLKGFTFWAYQKCGHLGEKATYRWAQDWGISLTMNLIKSVTLQCPFWQHIKHRSLPQLVKGQLVCGKLPGQMWQIDYIDPLIQDKGCQ